MKTLLAALIVALAIVFHAVAPSLLKEIEHSREAEAWVDGVGRIVCPSRGGISQYRKLEIDEAWQYDDDPTGRWKPIQSTKEALISQNGCEELAPGQIVTWVPTAPLPRLFIHPAARKAWEELGVIEHHRALVLVRYTSQDGVKKRGYMARLDLSILTEPDEPNR